MTLSCEDRKRPSFFLCVLERAPWCHMLWNRVWGLWGSVWGHLCFPMLVCVGNKDLFLVLEGSGILWWHRSSSIYHDQKISLTTDDEELLAARTGPGVSASYKSYVETRARREQSMSWEQWTEDRQLRPVSAFGRNFTFQIVLKCFNRMAWACIMLSYTKGWASIPHVHTVI